MLGLFQSTFPRGERRSGRTGRTDDTNFNPRSRVGNDVVSWTWLDVMLIFQSTFPRGERPNRHMLISSIINFNPRSRVGNDLFCLSYNFNCIISIHVPAWGTTENARLLVKYLAISIHVPAWGTTFVTLSISVIRIFQSTFPRGERHISIYRDYPGTSISIHVPAWGTTS